MKDPVQAVIVVPDRGYEEQDESAAAASLVPGGVDVEVLPEDAAVLFVESHNVLHYVWVAEIIAEVGIEIDRVRGAIAVFLERGGKAADAVLAGVEGVSPGPVDIAVP